MPQTAQKAIPADPKQKYIDHAQRTSTESKPWNENGENWITGYGLFPVEYPLLPRWNDPNRNTRGE